MGCFLTAIGLIFSITEQYGSVVFIANDSTLRGIF